MDLWEIRSQALEAMNSQFLNEKIVLETCISLVQELANTFSIYAQIDDEYAHLAAVCSQIMAKSYRLGLGCYSLCLETLALEAGSLGRLLLEAWQMLVYLHKDPARVENILGDKPPKAGDIAKDIREDLHDKLKGLRDYYNQHSSHLSFEKDALVPLNIVFNAQDLYGNIRSLYALLMSLIIDASQCLSLIPSHTDDILYKIEKCHQDGLAIFPQNEE